MSGSGSSRGSYGSYRSATEYSSGNAYGVYFNSALAYVNLNQTYRNAVRPFRGI